MQLAQERALSHPRRGFWWGEQCLSYAELDREARRLAGQLRSLSLRPGDRALLPWEAGLDFLRAFWGCLYAGLIAVPAPAPHPKRMARSLPRLQAIARDCQPQVVIAPEHLASGCGWLAPHFVAPGGEDGQVGEPYAARLEELAVLQYTSGSTRQPRGVRLTHGNLLHNLGLLQQFLGNPQELVMVHWLPLFHDMGLVRGMLSPLHLGGDCHLLDPVAFVEKPRRWLETITCKRATITGAPPFGLALACRKVSEQQLEGLDLSCLEKLFCSAEPISVEVLERFEGRFSRVGLGPGVIRPAYGLAEATVAVTGEMGPRWQSIGGRVSCGQALGDLRLRIVEPSTGRLLAQGEVGEIHIQGSSVSKGYWGCPEAWEDWLPSGDLGFLQAGQLVVCGRIKDCLIVRGQNFHPQDLEAAAEEACGWLRPGCSAVFQEDQALILVGEASRPEGDGEQAVRQIWEAWAGEFGLSLSALVLLPPGRACKTASGKIQRQATREAWRQGLTEIVFEWQARRQ